MSMLRALRCDIKGCTSAQKEEQNGNGWEGWGHIEGIKYELPAVKESRPKQIITRAYVCPLCMPKLLEFINTGQIKGD